MTTRPIRSVSAVVWLTFTTLLLVWLPAQRSWLDAQHDLDSPAGFEDPFDFDSLVVLFAPMPALAGDPLHDLLTRIATTVGAFEQLIRLRDLAPPRSFRGYSEALRGPPER